MREGESVFIDSNLWIYLFLTSDATAKRTHAVETLLLRTLAERVISVQVLNEVANVLLRKYAIRVGLVADFLSTITRGTTVLSPTPAHTMDALRLYERYRLSWFDALLIAQALAAGCGVFYSEDMGDGMRIEGELTIRNPFA